MLYSVQEASKLLNISRVTIYNKIDKVKDLHAHIKVKNNTKFITPEGIELIRQSIIDNNQSKAFASEQTINQEIPEQKQDTSRVVNGSKPLQDDVIKLLKEQILDLQKDKENLHNRLEQQMNQHQNTQVLLRQAQDQVFLLESGNDKKEVVNEPEYPEKQHDNKILHNELMESIKHMQENINSIQSANAESIKQFQDRTIELESGLSKKDIVNDELLTTLKQLQEKINSMESAASKKYWWQRWKN